MISLATHISLFFAAFLAATILPLQSEALLTALLAAGQESWTTLILAASAGNVAGSVVNWLLGRGLLQLGKAGSPGPRILRWLAVPADRLARAEAWYHRFGRWSLLFAWLPVVGDALTVVAGALNEKLFPFIVLVTIGKVGRYLALAAAVAGLG